MQVTFAINADHPEGTGDAHHLQRAFTQRGHQPRTQQWGFARHPNPAGEYLVCNATSDRVYDSRRFLAWLTHATTVGMGVGCPPWVAEWNSTAQYLVELDRSGTPTLPLQVATSWADIASAVASVGGLPVTVAALDRPVEQQRVLVSDEQVAAAAEAAHDDLSGVSILVQHLPDRDQISAVQSAVWLGGKPSHTLTHHEPPARHRAVPAPTVEDTGHHAALLSPQLADVVAAAALVRVDYLVIHGEQPLLTRVNAIDADNWLRLSVEFVDRFVDCVERVAPKPSLTTP